MVTIACWRISLKEDSLEIANAIGLSDGRVRQIVNKFKTEEINTANEGDSFSFTL